MEFRWTHETEPDLLVGLNTGLDITADCPNIARAELVLLVAEPVPEDLRREAFA